MILHINNYQINTNQNCNEVSPHTGHSGHHWKDLQRINTAEDVQKRESSYSLGGSVNGETTVENSMEVPWNTKQRAIIWPFNPTPRLRSAEIQPLDFQSSTIYSSRDRTHQNVHWRKMKTTWCNHTVEYYSAIKEKKWWHLRQRGWSEEISYKWGKSETRRQTAYHIQVESVSAYRWANGQNRNRLTDWENQIMIKRELEGRGKSRVSD